MLQADFRPERTAGFIDLGESRAHHRCPELCRRLLYVKRSTPLRARHAPKGESTFNADPV